MVLVIEHQRTLLVSSHRMHLSGSIHPLTVPFGLFFIFAVKMKYGSDNEENGSVKNGALVQH